VSLLLLLLVVVVVVLFTSQHWNVQLQASVLHSCWNWAAAWRFCCKQYTCAQGLSAAGLPPA